MVVVRCVHTVQLGQGPEPRPPVVQEVVIQVRAGGGTSQRAEAPGQRLRSLVAVDVQSVVREAVSVVIRLVFLHLDHHGHVAFTCRGLWVVLGLLDDAVEGGVRVAVRVTEQGAVVARRSED